MNIDCNDLCTKQVEIGYPAIVIAQHNCTLTCSIQQIDKRKDINLSTHIRIFITYIINMHVLTRMHTWVPTDKMCTYCSMSKQYMKRGKKKTQ